MNISNWSITRWLVMLVIVLVALEAWHWLSDDPKEELTVSPSYEERWENNLEKANSSWEKGWLLHNAPVQTVETIDGAIQYYHDALKSGSTQALYPLGQIYLHGIPGVLDPDLDKANFYLRQLKHHGGGWESAMAEEALDHVMNS